MKGYIFKSDFLSEIQYISRLSMWDGTWDLHNCFKNAQNFYRGHVDSHVLIRTWVLHEGAWYQCWQLINDMWLMCTSIEWSSRVFREATLSYANAVTSSNWDISTPVVWHNTCSYKLHCVTLPLTKQKIPTIYKAIKNVPWSGPLQKYILCSVRNRSLCCVHSAHTSKLHT